MAPPPPVGYGPAGGTSYGPPPAGGYGPPGVGGYGPPGDGGYGPPGDGGYGASPWGGPPPPPPYPAGSWPVWPGTAGGWYGQRPAAPRRTIPNGVIALLTAVAVLVGVGIGHGVWKAAHPAANQFPSQPANGAAPGGSATVPGTGGGGGGGGGASPGDAAAAERAAATVSNELVDIDVVLSYAQMQAEGTGIVLDSSGLVLTNNHVIAGATRITARDVGNGQRYSATVLGYDRSHDVALIQLQNASGLRAVAIGNSDHVATGDAVVGIGNAGGLDGPPSLAPGSVTALDQQITAQDESMNTAERLSGLIETNCDIQPGDSGGALINAAGQVIGVDTAASVGFSFQTQGNQGYAIPINQAMQIVSQIRSGQATATVHIGPTAFLGVQVTAPSTGSGAQVQGIIQGGAAEAAGLQAGDVITSLGGATVTSPETLTQLMSRYHPNDRVPITWVDPGGVSHSATVTMAAGPPQ